MEKGKSSKMKFFELNDEQRALAISQMSLIKQIDDIPIDVKWASNSDVENAIKNGYLPDKDYVFLPINDSQLYTKLIVCLVARLYSSVETYAGITKS